MNPIHELTADELSQLRERYTLQQIGDRYGLTRERVRQICQRRGVGRQTRIAARQRRIQAAVERCEEVGVDQTAREYGVTPQTIRAWGGRNQPVWTREKLIAAGHRYAERYGTQPSAISFNPDAAASRGMYHLVERFFDDHYPYTATIAYHFGSWNDYIKACGWTPKPSGRPHKEQHNER